MPSVVIRVVGAADGSSTPHDGRYVAAWTPHTKAGTLKLTSTDALADARRFDLAQAYSEWRMLSRVQSHRPWDKKPNRPLTAVSVEFIPIADA